MPATATDPNAPRPASSALTKTGGFLTGFTHSLQPYIGCAFGCAYCYVQGLTVHRCHRPAAAWGDYVHPRTGIAERLRREMARRAATGTLETISVFMSSATDPYQSAERHWRLSRACLDVFMAYPPGLLVVQTRSPLVMDDLDRLRDLGSRCWLSLTIETDREEVRRAVTPRCPALAQRWATAAAASAIGVQVQIAVSPCLPYSDVESFGAALLAHADRVVVDTYVSGDGQGGRRTAATATPALYAGHAWGDWRGEEAARDLHAWLVREIGPRAGWSHTGFTDLARAMKQAS